MRCARPQRPSRRGADPVVAADEAVQRFVREALAACPATRRLSDSALHRVHGGLSNHAWRAEAGGRGFFVRLSGPDAERLGVDRQSECALLETVAAAGLAPAVVACEPALGLMVTEFVSARPWSREDAHDPGNLRRLGELIGELHRLPAPPGVRKVAFAEQARHLEAQLAPAGLVDPVLRSAFARAGEVLATDGGRVTLCHNDLHHLNVLDDGTRLWIVDWEYGGLGDPLMDLASFLCQHESGPRERGRLLDACGDRQTVPVPRLRAACTVFDYVQWLWYRLWVLRGLDGDGEYSTRADTIARRLRSGPT